MEPIIYHYKDVREESKQKITDVVVVALKDRLQAGSGLFGLKPTMVVVHADHIVVEIHHYHPGMGIGEIAGFLTLTYDHQLACYQFVSYEEQRA